MLAFWNFFLEKRAFTWLLMIALVIGGVMAVVAIPKESAPEVVVPIGVISTPYLGASAEDVERLITNKLEDAVGSVEDLDTITSVSSNGLSVITVQFLARADVEQSIQTLKDAVERVKSELPTDAEEPSVTKINFQDQPVVIVSVSTDQPLTQVTALADAVSDALKDVPNVQRVDATGFRNREVQVVVHPEALVRYGLSIMDVTGAISAANLTLPVGTITAGGVTYPVQFEGDITDPEIIRDIPITTTGSGVVLVRDVATVSNGVEAVATYSRVSVGDQPAEPAITFFVYKSAGGDITTTAAAVRERLTELQAPDGLLADSQVLVSLDQGELVSRDLTELVQVGFETVALVTLALLITIGWRESLVAALSIPLSFVIAFIGLYVSDNTINFVSLFSLILAVGILVDSGIVVTEAIHTRSRIYMDKQRAARESLREYAWPLIAGTLTTLAVFLPLFFISGVVGEFIKSIPFTISFVLVASIFVALGMVPLIAILLTKRRSRNRLEELQEEYTERVQNWYRTKLAAFLDHKRAQRYFIGALIAGLIFSVALPFTGLIKAVFFPSEDMDFVYVNVEKPQGSTLEETNLALLGIEEILYELPYIESFTSTAGAASVFSVAQLSGEQVGNITVKLIEEREQNSTELAEDLRRQLSVIRNADISVLEQQGGPVAGAPVQVNIRGNDLNELARVANQAETVLASIPRAINVSASTKNIVNQFTLSIDRQEAGALGISPAQVASTLRTAVFGSTATTIKRQGEDIDVVVKLALLPTFTDPAETTDVTLDAIRNVQINTPQGPVILGSILSGELTAANASISHHDKIRQESVTADVAPGSTAGEVVSAFQARETELELPPGVTLSYGGETEDINQTFTEMFVALIAGLVLMLAILVLAFNSFRYAFYLLSVVPLSLIGVLDGLALTGQPISFPSLLGVVALAGVIINHAIILMDSMIRYRELEPNKNKPLKDTVIEAAVSRLRPIFLTTLATVIGMIPLSRVSDFWSPLAYAIMFGLAFAMVLTLILVPLMFYRRELKVAQH